MNTLRITLRGRLVRDLIQLTVFWILFFGALIWVYSDSSEAAPSHATTVRLDTILPYYHKAVPSWCMEDMICWSGSLGDNRSDAQLIFDLKTDIYCTSWAYGNNDPRKSPPSC